MLGIIGGSGLYNIEGVIIKKVKRLTTPFGAPSDSYRIGKLSGKDVIFLPRHGSRHNIPPHKINYRANIWGFKKLGVERVISVGAAGGISQGMKPGMIIVLDQIIDMTNGRHGTFFEGKEGVIHVDLTEPFCPELRECIIGAGKKSGIIFKKLGTYICTNGPRLETKAEIQFFSHIGADVVGMTAMPEASLAREAELCYAGISIISNYAAGIKEKKLTVKEVIEVMNKTAGQIRELLTMVFKKIPVERSCTCQEALKEAKV